MKLANVSWGWTPIPEDMPEGDSLIKIADQIRGLGFEGVDYLGTPEALDEFFTEEACRTLESIPDPLDWNRMFLFFRMTAGTPAAVKSGKTVSSILKRPRKRQNGSAAELYPLWCPCLAGRLPGSLIPRLRRSSKAIICRPATAIRRIGKP